jgi:osmotically-inducible protein OsmY
MAFPQRAGAPGRLQGEVQSVLARSSTLSSKDNMRVIVQGDTVVLQGVANDDHERRLAEMLVRLTPGVHAVLNQLRVPGEAVPVPLILP